MRYWGFDNKCGFVGFAIGHTAHIFADCGFLLDRYQSEGTQKYCPSIVVSRNGYTWSETGYGAVAALLDISELDVDVLFSVKSYDIDADVAQARKYCYERGPEPSVVAERIRQFVTSRRQDSQQMGQ